MSTDTIAAAIIALAKDNIGEKVKGLTADSALIGENAAMSSRELVELLLAVEEYAEEQLGVTFDWASDSAMSARRSIMRSPRSLAEHLAALQAKAKS